MSAPLIPPAIRDALISRPRRSRELEALGLSRERLRQLVAAGVILRLRRGVYAATNFDPSAHHTLALAAGQVPTGIVCLLSALAYHQITTQLPTDIWLMIDAKAWRPHVPDLPLRFVYASGPARTEGTTVYHIEGIPVQITTPAKTVADCFKYRRLVGLDVAIEALRDLVRRDPHAMQEVSAYAAVDRVANVIRPYLEALV